MQQILQVIARGTSGLKTNKPNVLLLLSAAVATMLSKVVILSLNSYFTYLKLSSNQLFELPLFSTLV